MQSFQLAATAQAILSFTAFSAEAAFVNCVRQTGLTSSVDCSATDGRDSLPKWDVPATFNVPNHIDFLNYLEGGTLTQCPPTCSTNKGVPRPKEATCRYFLIDEDPDPFGETQPHVKAKFTGWYLPSTDASKPENGHFLLCNVQCGGFTSIDC